MQDSRAGPSDQRETRPLVHQDTPTAADLWSSQSAVENVEDLPLFG